MNTAIFQPGETVFVPHWGFPKFSSTPVEIGRVVRGMSIIEDGLRLTLFQVRTNRQRSHGLRADDASWYSPAELLRPYSPTSALVKGGAK